MAAVNILEDDEQECGSEDSDDGWHERLMAMTDEMAVSQTSVIESRDDLGSSECQEEMTHAATGAPGAPAGSANISSSAGGGGARGG